MNVIRKEYIETGVKCPCCRWLTDALYVVEGTMTEGWCGHCFADRLVEDDAEVTLPQRGARR